MISHRIRFLSLAAAVLCAPLCLAGCSDGFVFRAEQSADGERYILEQYRGKQEHVVLPDAYRDAPVYAVWPHAFPYLTESVDVGAVKYIYREAFAGLGLLRHVDLGEAEILEQSAFAGCRALEAIVIPATMQTLGDGVFANCTALRSIYFEVDPQTWATISSPFASSRAPSSPSTALRAAAWKPTPKLRASPSKPTSPPECPPKKRKRTAARPFPCLPP